MRGVEVAGGAQRRCRDCMLDDAAATATGYANANANAPGLGPGPEPGPLDYGPGPALVPASAPASEYATATGRMLEAVVEGRGRARWARRR